MKCSIVIRAYNEGKYIGRLLEGIHQQTIKDVEIILVDSGSTDNTRQIAESYSVKIVHIPPHDFTFGRSLNLGIKHATNELIVIVSAHVFPVYPDWLERMLEPFANPNVVLTYGKQRGTPPKNRINTSHSQPDQVFHDLPLRDMYNAEQPATHGIQGATPKRLPNIVPHPSERLEIPSKLIN